MSEPISEPTAISGKDYILIKNWNFGVNIKNLTEMRNEFFTRYIYGNGKLDYLNDEWQRYRDNDNHVISKNTLKLVARIVNGLEVGGIESGMIRTKWSGQYGYFEARIKVPRGLGLWPAFWLNPQDQKWPPEIDVVEIVGNSIDGTESSFHFVHSGKGQTKPEIIFSKLNKRKSYRPGFDYSDGFHVFAVEWTENRVKHYVDDTLVIERVYEWKHSDGSDAGPAHLLMNLAVGGNWAGAPHSNEHLPALLEIDYIRVWQLKDT